MRVLCVLAAHNYGDPVRGASYEATNFIPALQRLGHTTRLFDSWQRQLRTFHRLNEALLEEAQAFRPDFILAVQMHYEIWSETWDILRAAGAATANWSTDDSWKYAQFSRFVAPCFDAIATTCPARHRDYMRDGHNNVLLTQWAANRETLRPPQRAADCRIPVSFIGSAHGQRGAWVKALQRSGIKVECFGFGWDHGPVEAQRIPEIIHDSVISLNFAGGAVRWFGDRIARANQLKARTFEVLGAGGFLLTEAAPDLDRYLNPGHEIATFQSRQDAAVSIRHFQSNPGERDKIARAGFERVKREHTYDQRISQLIEFTMERRARRSASSGAFSGVDWSRFRAIAARHQAGAWMRDVGASLARAAGVIVGPARGVRAARRFVFSTSWRVAGSRTYSSAGLPGRMFDGVW